MSFISPSYVGATAHHACGKLESDLLYYPSKDDPAMWKLLRDYDSVVEFGIAYRCKGCFDLIVFRYAYLTLVLQKLGVRT